MERKTRFKELDSGSSDIEDVGGTRIRQRKDFVVRWRRDIITTPTVFLSVLDEYSRAFNVEEVTDNSDVRSRRRFLTITAVLVT